jgi:hypothetical protein
MLGVMVAGIVNLLLDSNTLQLLVSFADNPRSLALGRGRIKPGL